MVQHHLKTCFSLFIFMVLACIHLDARAELVYGHDYLDVPGYQKPSEKKIPVIEFFWYQSDQCFELENLIDSWARYHSHDVRLIRVPIPFGNEEPMARVYYTLEASGYGDRFHKMLYHAIHVDNEDLSKGFDLVTWLSARGVNQTLFESDTHSPFVEKHLKKAAQLARRYSVLELPTLVVDNRYVTNLGFAGSPDRLYVILDKLLIKAKADRKAGH
ncbi:MAG: thiol:disulfide interchange protein DsbA/DsbL [Proteobacteria bacterium]|nr:thiol:disulfide interchange protein DsbA/DsbL [Pseudomonadota bacterium]